MSCMWERLETNSSVGCREMEELLLSAANTQLCNTDEQCVYVKCLYSSGAGKFFQTETLSISLRLIKIAV